MNIRKLFLAGAAVSALLGAPAQASIIDNPQFRVLGLVIVWGADDVDSGAPTVSDFIIGDVAGGTDLIADDVHAVVTGTLLSTPATALTGGEFEITGAVGATGVLDASAAFDAFEIDANTDVSLGGNLTQRSSFYVASNTAFTIEAVAATTGTPVGFTLDDIGYSLSVTESGNDGLAFGADAQFPHSGGTEGGIDNSAAGIDSLGDLTTAQTVFAGDQLTAENPGSIASQSVRFDAVYTLGGSAGYDLSDGTGLIETEVTYTVFVP